MNRVFDSYLHFEQLPFQLIKKVGATMEHPANPRFDLIEIAGSYPLANRMKIPSKGIAYISKVPPEKAFRQQVVSARIRNAKYILRATIDGKGKNFTGLFDAGCTLNGVYGYPDGAKVYYGNPEPQYGKEIYLFLMSKDERTLEVFVVTQSNYTMGDLAIRLRDGEFESEVRDMRERAKVFYDYYKK